MIPSVRLFSLACLLLVLSGFSLRADEADKKGKDKEEAKPATVVPVSKPDAWWQARHQLINDRAKKGDVDVLFVGDSITQGWEGEGAAKVWEKYFGEFHPMNAGIGGDRTQHVLWRLQNGNLENIQPKLMVLMIGTNNAGADSAEDIAAGIKEIVTYYRSARPESKVLVLGIFPRSLNEDELRKKVADASRLTADIADGKQVFYLDIGAKFLQPDGTIDSGIMPDYLHLSEAGYTIWGENVAPEIKKLISAP